MKKLLGLILLSIFLISGIVFADTNGVWTLAKDIRPGTFGSDETVGTFEFNDKLIINSPTSQGNLNIGGSSDSGKTSSAIYLHDDTIDEYNRWYFAKKKESGNEQENDLFIGYSYDDGGVKHRISMAMDSVTGNVGIGTTTPTQKLDILGKIRMRTQTVDTDADDIVTTKGYVDAADDGVKEWVCSQTGLELKPDGTCGPKPVHLGQSALGAYSCAGWGSCVTPTLNICETIPGIKGGDKFKITSTAQGSSWILSQFWVQSYEFTFGTAKTHSYTASGTKRNTNRRVYDGNCIVYGTSSYAGDSTNYKSVVIKLTNLDFEP